MNTRCSLTLVSLLLPVALVQAAPSSVEIQTNVAGAPTITLELDGDKAPVTVANFLSYLKEGFYKDTLFHRSPPNFVVQGGGFNASFEQKPTHAPIINEASNGLKNLRGTIAMARTDDPNSATSQFFINLVDNTDLDFGSTLSPDGYAVFGTVTGGMETLDAINKLPLAKNRFSGVPETFADMPMIDVSGRKGAAITAIVLLPNANAGLDQTVSEEAAVSLDGSSSDPGSAQGITGYAWTQTSGPTVALSGSDTAKPQFIAPHVDTATQLDFQLLVTNSDGKISKGDAVAIMVEDTALGVAENHPPAAQISAPATALEGEPITLVGDATDPDGDSIAAYFWQQTGGPAVELSRVDGPKLAFSAPTIGNNSGQLTFSLTVTDDNESNPKSEIGSVTVTINDNPALLDCSGAYPSQATLSPASKAMKLVVINGITGPNRYSLRISGVSSDEQAKGRSARIKKGRVRPAKPPADGVFLKADRQKGGNGRIYTVTFEASDGTQLCSGAVKVEVPPAKGMAAIDDGGRFRATGSH